MVIMNKSGDEMKRLGIDIGSTTIKAVVIDQNNEIIYHDYKRHKSNVASSLEHLLASIEGAFGAEEFFINFTGSAGMMIAKQIDVQFTQEVISATKALKEEARYFDVCIELGGEDAKIIFFDGINIEQRMNGTCAGGTGAFIDQMASLLNVNVEELNNLAKDYDSLYDIASRCGVFAKSDIQPLINQGASHANIAASIYQAIVNQTIAGLSQGRKIKGRVAFLGGPLTFSSELRKRFIETLHLTDVFMPEKGEVFVAYGAALEASQTPGNVTDIIVRIAEHNNQIQPHMKKRLKPLFEDDQAYQSFQERHALATLKEEDLSTYEGNAYLGIDAGSTTTKIVLLSEDNALLHTFYSHNQGNPIDIVKKALEELYSLLPSSVTIVRAFSTGYGEDLIKHAFLLDGSEVETICHYEAAKFFRHDVEFILDIGGQDMKCFTVRDGVIHSIMLNEACSSGCGSFLETFSTSLGYEIEDFAKIATTAKSPVDLGSRCTVFMNSGVKQAQAESASTSDISAGLAYSVVKNALYKVIRVVDVKNELGTNIVVQGGTFYNDAVLRAFEQELGTEVTRPSIAGLMGAFGAALLAKRTKQERSGMLNQDRLKGFTYQSKNAICKQCSNHCRLTINLFGKHHYISGNRCEKGANQESKTSNNPNLYLFKYDLINSYQSKPNKKYIKKVGLPMVLNMYENIPFWFTFFDSLGYEVIYSDRSNKALYELGQDSIPSDTICYPAKITHGHIENLIQKDVDYIFYPNMAFNTLEKPHQDNHYNCPVVAFYPELIGANIEDLPIDQYLSPYVSTHSKQSFYKSVRNIFHTKLNHSSKAIKQGFDQAMQAYIDYKEQIIAEGFRAISYANKTGKPLILLAGRPYHIDPEVNHGIPKLLRTLDTVVISEDSVHHLANQDEVAVLNQWTYHTRLYDAAKYISKVDNANLIQLVSFGCGLDAITADEVKDILAKEDKLYTQIKIDEVSNLGAVNIRIRSLLSTMRWT